MAIHRFDPFIVLTTPDEDLIAVNPKMIVAVKERWVDIPGSDEMPRASSILTAAGEILIMEEPQDVMKLMKDVEERRRRT